MARQLSQLLLAALLGGGLTAGFLLLAGRSEESATGSAPPVRQSGALAASATATERLSPSEIFERAVPAVVAIRARSVQPVASSAFDGGASPDQGISTGSGFVLDGDGHVVTSAQVVSGVTDVQVTFADPLQTLPARVVGKDEETDLAVLEVDPAGLELEPLELGDSDQVQVGDRALAIGNPSGLEPTAGTGVVAARGQQLETLTGVTVEGVMRTDAVVMPSTAGGPVLGADGRVIGISSVAAESGDGYAVPINTAKAVLAQLRENHKLIRPYLGIRGRTAAGVGGAESGAVLESVYPGGPAAQIGLRPGDRIEAIDGVPVASIDALLDEVAQRRPGDEVQLTVVRDQSRSVLEVTIAERPATLPSG